MPLKRGWLKRFERLEFCCAGFGVLFDDCDMKEVPVAVDYDKKEIDIRTLLDLLYPFETFFFTKLRSYRKCLRIRRDLPMIRSLQAGHRRRSATFSLFSVLPSNPPPIHPRGSKIQL